MQILEKKRLRNKTEQELIDLRHEVRQYRTARKSRIDEGNSSHADYLVYRQYDQYLMDIEEELEMRVEYNPRPKGHNKRDRRACRENKRNY